MCLRQRMELTELGGAARKDLQLKVLRELAEAS